MHEKNRLNPSAQNCTDERWGAGMTLLWSMLIILVTQFFVALVVLQANAALLGLSLADGESVIEQMPNAVMQTVIFGGVVGVLMIYAVIRLKEGSRVSEYLPFRSVSFGQSLMWLVAGTLVMLGSGLIFKAMGFQESQEMNTLLSGVTSKPLMYAALVIAAPIFEELLVRGFMLSGFERIKHVEAASIAVFTTAFLWTVIHAQYHAHEMFQVFLLGVVLGFARLKTKSLVTPILMHVVNNLMATAFFVLS